MKTVSANTSKIARQWHLVDAKDATLGRLSSQIAAILRGKNKPYFTPNLDTGDYVVVVNAEKVRLTGNKENTKLYWSHSGFPGGERSVVVSKQRELHPERIVLHAVKGMLPKGPLGRQMLKKLKVYVGENHNHQAQNPQPLALGR